jgi:hypothetical protein
MMDERTERRISVGVWTFVAAIAVVALYLAFVRFS